jgi:hypothetical protein
VLLPVPTLTWVLKGHEREGRVHASRGALDGVDEVLRRLLQRFHLAEAAHRAGVVEDERDLHRHDAEGDLGARVEVDDPAAEEAAEDRRQRRCRLDGDAVLALRHLEARHGDAAVRPERRVEGVPRAAPSTADWRSACTRVLREYSIAAPETTRSGTSATANRIEIEPRRSRANVLNMGRASSTTRRVSRKSFRSG